MFKKIMCGLLAGLMFVPALVSCANNEEEEVDALAEALASGLAKLARIRR